MSGVLSVLAAAGALFGGAGTGVTLGPVVLQGFEVPDKIKIGGKQSLVTHQLIGGGRVIDAMGRDDMPLTWTGILLDGSATPRALLLDSLRVSGQILTLSWAVFSYQVVVEEFTADYEMAVKIPYSITCRVVQDNSNQPSSTTPSLTATLGADLTAAQGYAAQAAVILGTTQAFLAAVGVKGGAAYLTGLQSVTGDVSNIAATASIANGTLGSLSGAAASAPGILPTAGGPTAAVTALNALTASAGTAAAAQQAGAYMGVAQKNLLNAST